MIITNTLIAVGVSLLLALALSVVFVPTWLKIQSLYSYKKRGVLAIEYPPARNNPSPAYQIRKMDKKSLACSISIIIMTCAIIFPLLVWNIKSNEGSEHTEATNSLCGAVCTCENLEKEVKVDCSRIYLSTVPPHAYWPLNITYINLSSNIISALDKQLSHGNLEVLDLSYNRITKVVQNTFGGLSKLKYLNLASNIIREFEENAFCGLNHLKSLNLSRNDLKVLPSEVFDNFIGLEELSLAGNPLLHINPILFNKMISLKWLNLSNTDLYSLPPQIFHTTEQVEFLDLSANDFLEVPTNALRSAKSLRHLRLNKNPIDLLDRKSFIKLSSLEVLELNNMDHLEKVLEQTFSSLKNLIVLELKYNRHLTSIDVKAFDGLFNASRPTLQELDLEGNYLHAMDVDTVACAQMRKFNVQKNPWVCNCSMKWIKECQIQIIYTTDLKCAYPEKLEGAMIYSLTEEDFTCSDSQKSEVGFFTLHLNRVLRSTLAAIEVSLLPALQRCLILVCAFIYLLSIYN